MDTNIKICTQKLLSDESLPAAMKNAVTDNPGNKATEKSGVPLDRNEIAVLRLKKWDTGRTLKVRFLDGVPDVQARVEKYAHQWEQYANIKFVFGDDQNAEIRISFKESGSWSYVGTDCLTIPKDQPTMNYGWLYSDTPETEYSRVVLHEFGHALGCIHEHQNPTADIPWDRDAVYSYYMGSPNYWSREEVDRNIFQHYSKSMTNFTQFDKESIMLYAIPDSLTIGDFAVGWNTALSDNDKQFMRQTYPIQNINSNLAVQGDNDRAAAPNDDLCR